MQQGRRHEVLPSDSPIRCASPGPAGASNGALHSCRAGAVKYCWTKQGACDLWHLLKAPWDLQTIWNGRLHSSTGCPVDVGLYLGLWLAGCGWVEGQRHDKGEARTRVPHDVKLVLRRLHMEAQTASTAGISG